jgi:hypothetical protein
MFYIPINRFWRLKTITQSAILNKTNQSLGSVHLKRCLNVGDWLFVVATAVMWYRCAHVMTVVPPFSTHKNLWQNLNSRLSINIHVSSFHFLRIHNLNFHGFYINRLAVLIDYTSKKTKQNKEAEYQSSVPRSSCKLCIILIRFQ